MDCHGLPCFAFVVLFVARPKIMTWPIRVVWPDTVDGVCGSIRENMIKLPSTSKSQQKIATENGKGKNQVSGKCDLKGNVKSCQPGKSPVCRNPRTKLESIQRKTSPGRLAPSVCSSYSFTSFPTKSHPSFSKSQRFNQDPHKEVGIESF
jgi:hypothetical protein